MAEFHVRKGEGDWADLPVDVMGKVIEKLSWVDRVRLYAVCKSWKALRGFVLDSPDFPWMLKFRNGGIPGTMFELFDPFSKKRYVADAWIEEKDKAIFANASIRCSRLGWLLLRSRNSDPSDPKSYLVSTFLLSPFTGELIKLPKLEEDFYLTNVATFSMDSTSPECIVFVFWRTCYTAGYSICCVGDVMWKTFKLEEARYQSYDLCPVDATYVTGSFYCLFADGEVGVLDLALQQWKLLEQCDSKLKFTKRYCSPKFLTAEADLLLCEYDNISRQIWRYNFLEKCWVADQKYGDLEVFISSGLPFEDGELLYELGEKRYEIFDGKSIMPGRGRMLAEFYGWLPKENNYAEVHKMWFDQRLVWRRNDLL